MRGGGVRTLVFLVAVLWRIFSFPPWCNHRTQLLSCDHDHTGGELVVGYLGSSRDPLWAQALTARNRYRMVRDGDDVGAGGVTESKRRDTGDDRCRGDDGGGDDHLPAVPAAPIDVAGVVGRDSGSRTWRRPNRLAGNDLVVKVSAQINACEISGSAGAPGRVPRSATSPCCKSPEYGVGTLRVWRLVHKGRQRGHERPGQRENHQRTAGDRYRR